MMSHIKLKSLKNFYGYNTTTIAGSFNGVTCTTSAPATLYDRWYFRGFAASVANDVLQVNYVLPKDYVSGKDITVRLVITYSDGSGGVVTWGCGITRDASVFGGESETTYITDDWTAPISSWGIEEKIFTFTGTSYVAGDTIAIIIYRNQGSGNDTLAATAYINDVEINTK